MEGLWGISGGRGLANRFSLDFLECGTDLKLSVRINNALAEIRGDSPNTFRLKGNAVT